MLLSLLNVFIIGVTLLQAPERGLWSDVTDPALAVRIRATEGLTRAAAASSTVLDEPSVESYIIEALEIENATIQRNLDGVKRGEKPLFGEEYGEHYSRVLSLADRLRERKSLSGALRTRLVRALIFGTYNDDSPFAQQLAKEGEVLVPHILDLVGSSNEPARWNAYGMIALLFENAESNAPRTPLSSGSRARLRAAARAGLQDPAMGVRRVAVKAVVAAKDRDAIPYLLHLAQTDPDTAPRGLSVRELAAAGAEALRRGP